MTRPFARIRQSAFATIAALGLVAVVGISLAALTALLARDVQRTVRQSQDAQLRQVLIAGEAAARASLSRDGLARDFSLKLPPELESSGTSITFEPLESTSTDTFRIRITARGADGRAMTQTLQYVRAAGRWELGSAEL
jgi:hypothetical protein